MDPELNHAIQTNNIKKLLEIVNKNYYEKLKLIFANANFQLIRRLLNELISEADPNFIDRIFEVAIENGNLNIIEYLVVNFDLDQDTLDNATSHAAISNQMEILLYLLEQGGDIHYHDNIAFTRTAEEDNIEMLEFLITLQFPQSAYDDALTSTCKSGKNLDMVRLLIANGANPNTRKIWEDEDFEPSAFEQAVIYDNLNIVEYFVNRGVDVTSNHNSSVIFAAKKGHLNVVKYLVEHGADLTAQNNLALIEASKEGHLNVVKYLVEQDADVQAQNNQALIKASYNGYLNVVEYLFNHGANVIAQNNKALKSIVNDEIQNRKIYRDKKHEKMIKLLLQLGATAEPDTDIYDKIIKLGIDPEEYKIAHPDVKVAV